MSNTTSANSCPDRFSTTITSQVSSSYTLYSCPDSVITGKFSGTYIAIYNYMKNYLSQNSKIKKMTGVKTFNWGIPAFRSKDGFSTCPKAGICAKGCYAKQGAYTWSNVSQAFENRLTLSQSNQFIDTLNAEIKRRKVQRLRIHDSGDFYNAEYLDKWLKIVQANPDVQFYAYTKMVEMFKSYTLPNNFPVISR